MQLENIAVFGCNGAIGNGFIRCLADRFSRASIHAFSRKEPENRSSSVVYHAIDYQDEISMEQAANEVVRDLPLDLVIVAIGVLHDDEITPEKSLKELSVTKFQHVFAVNTIAPALIAKYFLPKLNRLQPARFAVLSARAGSISDNQMGGWYGYRASKAALNMFIKSAAIETARRNKQAIIVSLHPGTVDSALSRPFQRNVPVGKLFTPDYAAGKLLDVLANLTPSDSGGFFAWDGEELLP